MNSAVRARADDPAMTTQLPHLHPDFARLTRGCPLAVRLDREWQVLAARPATLRRARAWGLGVPFASLDDLVAATGYRCCPAGRNTSHHHGEVDPVPAGVDPNNVVARLLQAARTDDLAARVLLQRLLPGLVALARRWQRRHGAATDAFDEVVAAAWAVVREFPLDRRPEHLVPNLLRDAEYHAFIRPHRRALVHVPVSGDRLDHVVESHGVVGSDALGELAEVVAITPSLSAHDRKLLALLLSGRTTLQVAAALKVSERTVRAHRDSMVVRMRQAVAA